MSGAERPSTRNLAAMPARDEFIRITKAMATLDAILSPDWDGRYYSFDSTWGSGEQMASMRDGCGDEWRAHITDHGIVLFGLAHESAMYRQGEPWPGVLDELPDVFAASVAEPAFDTANLSFCIWLLADSTGWRTGQVEYPTGFTDPDGSVELLSILDGNPATYRDWAEDYYETDVDLSAVEAVYAGARLATGVVTTLNPDLNLADIDDDLATIGYP